MPRLRLWPLRVGSGHQSWLTLPNQLLGPSYVTLCVSRSRARPISSSLAIAMEPSREAPGPSGFRSEVRMLGSLRWRKRELLVPAQHRFRRIAVALLVWASAAAIFPADLDAGLQVRGTNDRADRGPGHQLDPQGIAVPRAVQLA